MKPFFKIMCYFYLVCKKQLKMVFYFIKDNDYNEQIVKKEAKLIEDYKKLA